MITSLRLMSTTLLVLFVLIAGTSFMSCESTSDAPVDDNTVRIGTLLPLTGPGAEYGKAMRVSLEIAAEDFNNFLTTAHSELIVEIDSADTKGDPVTALQQLEEMAGRGIKIIVGPQSTVEIVAVVERAKELGVILLSASAIVNSLTNQNDNFFSLIPDHAVLGDANADYLKSEGITHLIAVHFDDPWGNDMLASLRPQFEANGGIVDQVIKYTGAGFNPVAIRTQLSAAVASVVAAHGAEKVGVALFSYPEGVAILREAAKDPTLDKVKWIGGAALENDHNIQRDKDVVSFVQKVGFPCAAFAIDPQAQTIWQPVMQKLLTRTGHDGDSYSLAAYDALWLSAYTMMDAGSDDAETLGKVLMNNSQSYFGASGWTGMNEHGNRRDGNFDFWSVRAGMDGFGMWYRSHIYEKQPDGQYILRKL